MSEDLTLCLTARFLTGTYHGRDRDGEPEWPPSPLRLFQALVAAAGSGRNEAQANALRWLECLPTPTIAAHTTKATGTRRKHYVPNNDADREMDRVASREEKVFRPLHLPDGAEVQYRWSLTHDDRSHAEVVIGLTGRLRCLGWGIDTVAGRGGFDCTWPDNAQQWTADTLDASGKPRRIPIPGTLKSLDAAHQAKASRFQNGSYKPSDANVATRSVTYRSASVRRPLDSLVFSVVRLEGGADPHWPAKATHLAGQVRHAARLAAQRAGWGDPTVKGYVCGHEVNDGNRLSFLPLPSIGHQHTDGMVRRVLIASPPGNQDRLRALRARLIGPLQPGRGEPTTAITPGQPDDKVVRRYCRPSRFWATVTPVVFIGHYTRGRRQTGQDGGDPLELTRQDLLGNGGNITTRKAGRMMARMLQSSGIDVKFVHRIVLSQVPQFPNLPCAGKYAVPANLKHLPRSHVQVVFDRPVTGPLGLGVGQFRGLGTLANLPD